MAAPNKGKTKEEWLEIGKDWAVNFIRGMSIKEFAESIGVCPSTARYHLRKLGYNTRPRSHGMKRGEHCNMRNEGKSK